MIIEIRDWKKPVVAYKGQPIYIRFGMWSSRSYNFNTYDKEAGVSVYRGRLVDGAADLAETPPHFYAREFEGRFIFAVTGEEVCEGSDGEPVLTKVKVLNLPIRITARYWRKETTTHV